MNALTNGYKAEFGSLDKEAWHKVLSRFKDTNLYQTWSYDMVRSGRKDVAHMILRKGDTVVAAAQARIVRLPLLRKGIAYVMWGPMWHPAEASDDAEVFRQAVRALKNEFSCRRGLVLRIYPLAFREQYGDLEKILQEEGYASIENDRVKRTLILDLNPPLEEIRANLDQKWRNCLNRSEKNGLELIVGEEEALFSEVTKIYWEMVSRKKLVELSDIDHLKAVQRDLPPALKLKVILCRLNDETCAGGIFSTIGSAGVYLVGATSDVGMKTNGSYTIQWAFLKWLKENGFLKYDLNGINPHTNPGTYHFKRGLAGKHGREVEFLGKFQVADSILSDLVVRGGERLLSAYRRMGLAGKSSRNAMKKGN
jgi:hypothetical protein